MPHIQDRSPIENLRMMQNDYELCLLTLLLYQLLQSQPRVQIIIFNKKLSDRVTGIFQLIPLSYGKRCLDLQNIIQVQKNQIIKMQNTSQQINKSVFSNQQTQPNQSKYIQPEPQLRNQQFPEVGRSSLAETDEKKLSSNIRQVANEIQCRICLQNDDIENGDSFVQLPYIMSGNNNPLISPCRCSGSLKNIHAKCLKQWIQSQLNNSLKKLQKGISQIQCQLCTEKIYFTTKKQLQCKTKQQIKRNFLQNIKYFVLLMLLLLINLGFFSALLNYLLLVGFKTLISNVVLVSLIISGQVIFSIVSVVTMVCIINRYFFIRKIIVKDILDNPNAKGNKTSFTVNDANKMEEKCDRILKNHNKNQDDE